MHFASQVLLFVCAMVQLTDVVDVSSKKRGTLRPRSENSVRM